MSGNDVYAHAYAERERKLPRSRSLIALWGERERGSFRSRSPHNAYSKREYKHCGASVSETAWWAPTSPLIAN